MRQELKDFAGVAADPAGGFLGELRDYQRDGLGWLEFLQRFGFGGCLADDMGLGKTIQVLALLEGRREIRRNDAENSPPPALVVVPRSLVFHWKGEAARFTPNLRILDHTGAARLKPGNHFDDYDVILTTYGTLTRDAVHLKNIRFDYCILDEAQAVKNCQHALRQSRALAQSRSSPGLERHAGGKSPGRAVEPVRVSQSRHARQLRRYSAAPGATPTADAKLLAQALRPFILRRTKGQVAKELPAKTEQTLYCDLEPRASKLYNELRDYYRAKLAQERRHRRIYENTKFQVLEALLRLRQAACHPGLIDKANVASRARRSTRCWSSWSRCSRKITRCWCFRSSPACSRSCVSRLDEAKITYDYLDGRTRDRQARVEQFQNDPDVKLFLISLKAGGLGLNLYAAEYVYLLDPWWNPAVEAQAIDRAHRIGQTRHVFAYRLIARDTVEEKVLELQKSKRDLADAIITADNSVMRNLTREDLELLLS